MIKNGLNNKYEIIWLIKDRKLRKKLACKNVRFVNVYWIGTLNRKLSNYLYAMSSKYVFYTHSLNWVGHASKEQLYIDLWHGYGYKAQMEEKKIFFDYCIVPGPVFVETKSHYFSCPADKILPLGYPRYDLMLHPSERAQKYVHETYKKNNKTAKLVLWMPTFRHSSRKNLTMDTLKGAFDLPIATDLDSLKAIDSFCSNHNIYMIIKRHFLQEKYVIPEDLLTHITLMDDQMLNDLDIQLYDLIGCSDALLKIKFESTVSFRIGGKRIGCEANLR